MKRLLNYLILLAATSCMLFSCVGETTRLNGLQRQRRMVEDSIGNGHFGYAFKAIDKYMAEAGDSTTYYLWLSTRNKAFFSKMMVDSMEMAKRRAKAFLDRNKREKTKAMQLLRAEWMMAQGVMEMAFWGRPDLGLDSNKKAADIIRKSNGDNKELLLTALTNTADCYRQMGQMDYSADTYMQALALADSMPNNRNASIVVELGIATAYSFMADYENGEYWWKRIERKADSILYDDQFRFYNNRGNDLYFQHRYKEAMPYFEKAARLVKGNPQKEWDYYTALANMGENYVCLGKSKEARWALAEADAFFRKVDFRVGSYYITTSYIGLAMLEGKPKEALDIMKASNTSEHMIPAAVMQRLEREENVMCQLGHTDQAYDIHKKWDAIKDSIQTVNMCMRMNTNLLKFKHDKQLAEQQHVIDQQRIMSITAWALLVVALLAVAILIILFFLQRKRNLLHEMEDRQTLVKLRMENARNRISPHFVYNALNHELLAQMKGKKVDIFALTQLLRRGLAQANNLETTLKEEMDFVNYYVEIEGLQMGDDFKYNVEVGPKLDIGKVKMPAMAVQIFVENAIKHGLRAMAPREGKQRQLCIRIGRSEDKYTMVEVIDNGLGLQANGNDSTHTGMRILKQTMQILNDRNKLHISFGIENSSILETGHTGCRSWIVFPDDYDYSL